jgi:hypothetical protein
MISHVKREANSVAHHLAKFALYVLPSKYGWRIYPDVFMILFY